MARRPKGNRDDKKVIKSGGHRAHFDVTMLTNTAILDPLTKTAHSPKLDKKSDFPSPPLSANESLRMSFAILVIFLPSAFSIARTIICYTVLLQFFAAFMRILFNFTFLLFCDICKYTL